MHTTELLVPKPITSEIAITTEQLKKYQSPDSHIPAEFRKQDIKYQVLKWKLTHSIFNEKEFLQQL
jgi:hypothetical protein